MEWYQRITVERALKILGLYSIDDATKYGPASRAIGAWNANDREAYSAWGSLSDAIYGTSLTRPR